MTSLSKPAWPGIARSNKFFNPRRRMVNLTYVLWVCAHSTLMLTLLLVVDNVR